MFLFLFFLSDSIVGDVKELLLSGHRSSKMSGRRIEDRDEMSAGQHSVFL